MNEYVIQGATLTGIADAIRAKLKTDQQYTPESMAAAIRSIQGGSTENEDAILSRQLSGEYVNDRVESLGIYSLAEFGDLTGAHLAGVLSLGTGALQNNKKLVSIYLPLCKTFGTQCLTGCTQIKYLSFPSAELFSQFCFSSCANLIAFVLTGTNVCTLSSTTCFNNTPIASGTGYIYVPDDLVEQYKVATNWATYANQIKGRSEIPPEVQEWLNQQEAA